MRKEQQIGNNIRIMRELRNMTRIQLAAAMQSQLDFPVSEYMVGTWQRGTRSISAECLLACAVSLRCTVYQLYGDMPKGVDPMLDVSHSLSDHELEILRYVFRQWDGNIHSLIEFMALYAVLPVDVRYDISGYGINVYKHLIKDGYKQDDESPKVDLHRLICDWNALARKAYK